MLWGAREVAARVAAAVAAEVSRLMPSEPGTVVKEAPSSARTTTANYQDRKSVV